MNPIEILSWLRTVAPEDTAMTGDPVGLLIHPAPRDIGRVGVCLDATSAVVNAAAHDGVQLLVCHHPLIYRPLATIAHDDPIGQSVSTLIREGIALYAMHTNWDLADGGINDTLAQTIGLSRVRPLAPTGDARIARIGSIAPQPLSEFVAHITDCLDTTGESALRFSRQFSERVIQTVAVCGGAGAFLLPDALAAGADAFLTSDVRHHEFIDAAGRKTILLDAGHGATERPGMEALAERLRGQFPLLSVTYFG